MTKDTIRSRNVQSRSLNFHVLEAGEDRPGEDPVILLHGYPQTSHMWRHQMPVLGERFKVYAPDRHLVAPHMRRLRIRRNG